jgi:hypothetical protein
MNDVGDTCENEIFERLDPASQHAYVRSSLGYVLRNGRPCGRGSGLIYAERGRQMEVYGEAGTDCWIYEITKGRWLPPDVDIRKIERLPEGVPATEEEHRRVAGRVARALHFLQFDRFVLYTPWGAFHGGDGKGLRFEPLVPPPTWTHVGEHSVTSSDGVRVSWAGTDRLRYEDAGRSMSVRIAPGCLSWQRQVALGSLERWLPPHHALPVTHADRDRVMERLSQAMAMWGYDHVIFVREFDSE